MCRAACDRSQVIRSNSNPTVARVTWLTRLCQIVLCEDWPGLEKGNSHRPAPQVLDGWPGTPCD